MASKEEMINFLKEHPFTEDTYNKILEKFDLQNVDLNVEKTRIEEKRSYLSARQRKAVLELLQIKELSEEIKKDELNNQKMQETAVFTTN